MSRVSGRCLCGEVTWVAERPVKWSAYCHCESCRRAFSAPFVAWLGIGNRGLEWSGPLVIHGSSEDVERGHCGRCGAPMLYRNESRWPDETHIPLPALHDPSGHMPQAHVHYDERLPWIEMRDGLPKYHGTGDDGTRPLDDDEAHG